ncbi:hypothetical protein BDZ89DRAFT_479405 [Hymenopellis radicata]|nr:hypothetical protein BDZ89DRAFT_479405 [Hymenopellis radicata]
MPNRQFDWSKVRTYNFQILQQALYYDAPWRQIDHLHQTLAQSYMDQIQATLDGLKENENLDLRRKCIKCLRGLSQCYSILPSSFYVSVSSGLLSKEDRAVGGGGFSDVYRGTYKAQPVALKVLRIHEHGQFNETNVIKAFCQEVFQADSRSHSGSS